MVTTSLTNWGGNVSFAANRVAQPHDVAEVQRLVRQHARLKVLGAGHSFSDIADSSEIIVSLENMTKVVSFDESARRVTVEGGIRYDALSDFLHAHGHALRNLASIGKITVAGAAATATHGGGASHPILAADVVEMQLILGSGQIMEITNRSPHFEAFRVHLGAFGIVTRITLEVVPRYLMRQDVYEELPFRVISKHLHEILTSGYSTSLFLDFASERNQLWIKTKLQDNADPAAFQPPETMLGARRMTQPRHPVAGFSAATCTPQGQSGWSHEILPHFRSGAVGNVGVELQSEYFLPVDRAVAALEAIHSMKEELAPWLLATEIRAVAFDRSWLGPCPCASVAFHFTWKQNPATVRQILSALEARIGPLGARPHWGKLFDGKAMKWEVLYPRLADFRRLAEELDREGIFRNPFLTRLFE